MSDTAVVESGTRLQNFLDRAGLRGFPWKTASILYTISWGWIFLVRDSLWADDWARFIIGETFEFTRLGLPPWLNYERSLFHFLGLTGIRCTIFLSFFLSGLAMYGAMSQSDYLNYQQRKLFVLLFLVFPFNTARVALQSFHYTISYFFFFLGWYLITNFRSRKIYLISLGLFLLSFAMHSLLVFYILPALHLILLEEAKGVRKVVFWIKRNYLFVSLPFIYWLLRAIYWPETDPYHNLTVERFVTLFSFLVSISGLSYVVFRFQKKLTKFKQSLVLMAIGCCCLLVGILPYVVAGFFPVNLEFFCKYLITFLGRSDWYSRHQILEPLGAAILVVGVVEFLSKFLGNAVRQIRFSVLAGCLVFNLGFGFEYVVDFSKQKAVVAELGDIGKMKVGHTFQFIDQTVGLNVRGRIYRPWDWSGLVWRAYGFSSKQKAQIEISCETDDARLVLIQGPETHWEALKNWVSDGDMGFEVTVDDTPGACKPEMATSEKVSGSTPILFYFTGAKG